MRTNRGSDFRSRPLGLIVTLSRIYLFIYSFRCRREMQIMPALWFQSRWIRLQLCKFYLFLFFPDLWGGEPSVCHLILCISRLGLLFVRFFIFKVLDKQIETEMKMLRAAFQFRFGIGGLSGKSHSDSPRNQNQNPNQNRTANGLPGHTNVLLPSWRLYVLNL